MSEHAKLLRHDTARPARPIRSCCRPLAAVRRVQCLDARRLCGPEARAAGGLRVRAVPARGGGGGGAARLRGNTGGVSHPHPAPVVGAGLPGDLPAFACRGGRLSLAWLVSGAMLSCLVLPKSLLVLVVATPACTRSAAVQRSSVCGHVSTHLTPVLHAVSHPHCPDRRDEILRHLRPGSLKLLIY